MAKRYHSEQWQQQAKQTSHLDPLYVVSGNEELLHIEACDAIRALARRSQIDERISFHADAQTDWSQILAACQMQSLFGGSRLVEIDLPNARPGQTGAKYLTTLAHDLPARKDLCLLISLPYLNQKTQKSAWVKALQKNAIWIDAPTVQRGHLSQWIQNRLAWQNQQCDEFTAKWLSDQVEGHLLAAYQEIQKLGLLYSKGNLSLEEVQKAVLNVARYNIFDLREAILSADTARAIKIVQGLKAEGEPLPLILWVLTEEIRLLAQLRAEQEAGLDLRATLRAFRVFGQREKRVRQVLSKTSARIWSQAIAHAYDIDQIIKGYPVAHRMDNPWAEIQRLCVFITQAQLRN